MIHSTFVDRRTQTFNNNYKLHKIPKFLRTSTKNQNIFLSIECSCFATPYSTLANLKYLFCTLLKKASKLLYVFGKCGKNKYRKVLLDKKIDNELDLFY